MAHEAVAVDGAPLALFRRLVRVGLRGEHEQPQQRLENHHGQRRRRRRRKEDQERRAGLLRSGRRVMPETAQAAQAAIAYRDETFAAINVRLTDTHARARAHEHIDEARRCATTQRTQPSGRPQR